MVIGVDGVYDMILCLALGGVGCVGGECVTGLSLGFTNSGEHGESGICVCVLVAVVWVGGLGQGLGGCDGVVSVYIVSLDYLCRWQVQVSVYCARRIYAHLRCTQCSILLHLIDICFLTCICLWQISQIQTCLRVVVGHPTFMRNIASSPVGPHGRLAQTR